MADNVPNLGRSRGALASFQAPVVQDTSEDGVDWFKLRVNAQRFANENAPLFAAFALMLEDRTRSATDLSHAIMAATSLARKVASAVTDTEDPDAAQILPFRRPAAELVARIWKDGKLGGFDSDAAADAFIGAFSLVNEDLDSNVYAPGISDDASLAMTAGGVSLILIRPVMTYAFRRDPGPILLALTGAVIDVAADATAEVVPRSALPEHRRSVLQTFSNRLAEVMASTYERKARQTVAHIASLPEGDRAAFSQDHDPIPEIVSEFREWGRYFAAMSLAFAGVAANVVRGNSTQVPQLS